MTKQIQANHMNMKSVRKFWQFTLLFFLALIVFNELLSKLYESIRKALLLNDVGVFLILAVLFALLFWELIGKIKDNKQVSWKLRDTFIVAVMIKSLWLIIWAFITLSFVPLSYFSIIDFSIYQWVSSNTFKNIHLILAFVYGAGVYLTLKFYYWDSMATKLNRIKKRTEVGFELNDDRTLGETEAFQSCKTLEELKEQDKLGRFDYAQQISHIIINNGKKKSFAIGINGECGSGKTSFIQMVRSINELQYNDHCIFINFNPWYFTGTEKVLKKFYDTLINAVGNNFSITFRNDLSKYFELICATESKIWKTNFLRFFQKKTDFESQLEKLKVHFKDLPQRIVIVIDDLDRLQKDEILVLFRTIRLIGDFPNVVYLVGYSHDYVRSILEENKNTTNEQASFMEKIFQLEFELPEPLVSDLKNILSSNMEEFIPQGNSGFQEGIIEVILKYDILPTLRDIKRFFNQIKINTSLPEIRHNTYLPQFFLLELIFYYDTDGYYELKKANSLEYNKDTKESTKKIIGWITGLESQSPLSITDPNHKNKYFFKRLDKKEDLDMSKVSSLFNNSNYEDKIEEYYDQNRKIKLIDNFNEFIKGMVSEKESIDKILAKTYLNRILFLLEYSFKSEGLTRQYFESKDGFLGFKLISGLVTVWNKVIYENPDFLDDYFTGKNYLDCYSYAITNLVADKNREEIHFDFNSLFIKRIETQCNKMNLTPLLIDLFNYQLFWESSNNETKKELHWLSNQTIRSAILNYSENIGKEIDKIRADNSKYKVISFLGSNENLLELNDTKNQGIIKMLDMQESNYPIKITRGVNEFCFNFNHPEYNYELNIPNGVQSIKILNDINEVEYEILKVGHNYTIKTEIQHGLSESLSLMNESVIQFNHAKNGLVFTLRERANGKNNYVPGDYPLYKTNITKYKVNCISKNNVDFILIRELASITEGIRRTLKIPFQKS